MLNTLTVWNFALLERVQIEFDQGLNILTGETGAGKSILIDALGVILGGRLSVDFIREGADWLRVEAVFSLEGQSEIIDFLMEHAIDLDNDEVIITRQITANGRGSILINGCHTTVGVLKKLGVMLFDIHGQNENLALLKANNRFALLDGESQEIRSILADYKDTYRAYNEITEKLEQKRQAAKEYSQRLDMLRWQMQEIEEASLQENEDILLQEEIRKLANMEKIVQQVEASCQLLYGGRDEGGIVNYLDEVLNNLQNISRYDKSLVKAEEIIHNAAIEIKEAAYDIRDYSEEMDFDPVFLDKCQSRMNIIERLCKKYGSTVADVLLHYKNVQQELSEIENHDEIITKLQEERDKAFSAISLVAEKLSALRKEIAQKISGEIEGHLMELGMPSARFEITVTEGDDFTANGRDMVDMLFSANPGQSMGPLQKIASGGELSRIALAIKTLLASRDSSPASMVFDEIDTGIGGKTAKMVAERIVMVAAKKQVLCITHLPQIACMADRHLYISKESTENNTATRVQILSPEERIHEIARMASGASLTAASLDNAKEMLVYGEARRNIAKTR